MLPLFSFFFGVCAAAFLPTYVAALYWKRATVYGIWASIISGVGASLFGLLFMHRKESAGLGICQAIFGKTELISTHPWPHIDPFIYALPISVMVLIVVSCFTEKLPQRHITRCFKK